MPGRNANALPCQVFRHAGVGIAFGCKGYNLRESTRGVEQPLHRIDIGRLGGFGRMGANVAGLFIQERALDMDSPNHRRDGRVGVAHAADIRKSSAHRVQVRGDYRRQNSSDALNSQLPAYGRDTLDRKLIGIEIDIGVTVNLQVDIAAWNIHNR